MTNIRILRWHILFLVALFYSSLNSFAGVFELSGGLSLDRSNYGDGSYTWDRRYMASLGYHITEDSEFEFSFQDNTSRNVVTNVQDVTFHDQVYSLDFNYYFFEDDSLVRPFFKVGVGQLIRDATGTYTGGYSPPAEVGQVTVIGGAGIRIKVVKKFSLKAEMTTYLTNGGISTWQDNLALSFGVSYFF